MGKNGAKNLIPYPYAETTKTDNGVTFTDNGDGTITVSTVAGGATAETIFSLCGTLAVDDTTFPNNTELRLNGCPANGSQSTYFINFWRVSDSTAYRDYGEGAKFTTNFTNTHGINLVVEANTVITEPITFRPMVYYAEDTDPTYQPYAMNNQELTKKAQNTFYGHKATWDALSTAEKIKYEYAEFDDDEEADTVDVVADGVMNPVTSNAVYDAMSQKFLYKRLQGTTDNFGLLSTGLLATDYYVLGADSQDVSINSFRSSNGYWYMHVFDATGETKKQTNIDTTIIYTPNDNLVSDGS